MLTFETDEISVAEENQLQAELIAADFISFLNIFHSFQQPFDDGLDKYLHESYLNALNRGKQFPKTRNYFSPSSSNSDPRELYEKIRGAKRDSREVSPHQRRWTSLGTSVGDMMQREILLAERHYKRFTGTDPRFKFERNEYGEPAFEDFVMYPKSFKYNGYEFTLFGTCDGILLYVNDEGEIIRVGLEIKSKQTTYSATGVRFNKPKEDHVKQVTCYSMMYNVDFYIICYVNTSKKSWFMDKADLKKHPDIKAFGVYISPEMKEEVAEYFVDVLKHVEAKVPPALDITKWTFNNYKTACAKSLSDEEVEDLKKLVSAYSKSGSRNKNQVVDAYFDILRLREEQAT